MALSLRRTRTQQRLAGAQISGAHPRASSSLGLGRGPGARSSDQCPEATAGGRRSEKRSFAPALGLHSEGTLGGESLLVTIPLDQAGLARNVHPEFLLRVHVQNPSSQVNNMDFQPKKMS